MLQDDARISIEIAICHIASRIHDLYRVDIHSSSVFGSTQGLWLQDIKLGSSYIRVATLLAAHVCLELDLGHGWTG